MNKTRSFFLTVFILLISASLFAQKFTDDKQEIDKILKNINDFSIYIQNSDYKNIGLSYTKDAKIFPERIDIIKGRDSIVDYWKLPKGTRIVYHKIIPREISIIDNKAFDYGYYEGQTSRNGNTINWKGKYVIIWKKVGEDWKIYLDIWNTIK